jgi:amidohydrolase
LDFACLLAKNPFTEGRILLLFQPSEENGNGAQAVIKSTIFENYRIDFAFALHNIPEFPLGMVLCKSESFSCAVLSCEMKFVGKSAHASEPEKSVSPQTTIFEIINRIPKLQVPDFISDEFFLATLIELHIGEETYGVAPGNGLMRWTFRAKTNAVLQQMVSEIETFSKQVTAQTSELQFSIRYLEAFFANENNPEAVEIVYKAVAKLGFNYQQLENGFRWGEDFGLFTQQIPGAMFGLGAGNTCPPLHSDDYQFPDELIETGSKMFYQIAESCIGS